MHHRQKRRRTLGPTVTHADGLDGDVGARRARASETPLWQPLPGTPQAPSTGVLARLGTLAILPTHYASVVEQDPVSRIPAAELGPETKTLANLLIDRLKFEGGRGRVELIVEDGTLKEAFIVHRLPAGALGRFDLTERQDQ
jgi:hypothetical protein